MPGRTPTNVPTSAPSRQKPMLYGCAATEKPSARFARSSLMTVSAQYQGQSWNGSPSKYTNSATQNAVIATAAIRLSTQRISVVPQMEIMKAAKVDGIKPSGGTLDRKSTRLNSSHLGISYA